MCAVSLPLYFYKRDSGIIYIIVDRQFRGGYCQFSDSSDQIWDQEEAFLRLKLPDKSTLS